MQKDQFLLNKNKVTVYYLTDQNFSAMNPCINPFPNKPWFLRVCRTSLLKTLREKEKLLVTSNFSFSHSVFNLFAISSNLKLSSAKSFSWKSLTFVVWERVKQSQSTETIILISSTVSVCYFDKCGKITLYNYSKSGKT